MRITVNGRAADQLIEMMESSPEDFEAMIVNHLRLVEELERGNPC